MSPEHLGTVPPVADPEKRKIAAQKSNLTKQIHGLEISLHQLETTGPEAAAEIEKRRRELWEKQVERNALDGLPPPPEPIINKVPERSSPDSVVEDAEEGVQRRIGTQNKKKMDSYSEAMKDMEDEYDRVEGAKLRAQEEEKIDESLDHLIDEYEREGVSAAKKANKRTAFAASPKPASEENKDTGSVDIKQEQPKKEDSAPAVDAVPLGDSEPVDIAPPQAPEAASVVDAQNASSAEQTPGASAANAAPENRTPVVEPVDVEIPLAAAERGGQGGENEAAGADAIPAADIQNASSAEQTPVAPVASTAPEGGDSAVETEKEVSIKDARSFKELFRAIGSTHGITPGFSDFSGGLKNKDGRFGAQGFEDLIRRVGRGEAKVESIPKEYGIREKVIELIANGEQVSPPEVAAESGNGAGTRSGEASTAQAAASSGEFETVSRGDAADVRANYDAAMRAAREHAARTQSERARSWWVRAPQATRDAALLSVLKTDEWLKNRSRWKKVAVVGGVAGILAFMYLGKDWQGEQDLVQNVSQGGAPSSPKESRSFFDQIREWFSGGSGASSQPPVGSGMTSPISPEVVSGVFEHAVKKGDTVWSIVQHMLPEKFPASVFSKLGPEQVAYITDGLKDALEKLTPQQLKEFGISSGNIGKIFPGDNLNLTKLFENQTLLNDLLEKARGLTQDQIQNIARNIRLGRM